MVAVPRAQDATVNWLSIINATFEPVPFKEKIFQAVRARKKAAMGCKNMRLLTFGCSNLQRFLPAVGFRAWCQTLAKLTHVGPLSSSPFTPLPNIWTRLQMCHNGQDLALVWVTTASPWLLYSWHCSAVPVEKF